MSTSYRRFTPKELLDFLDALDSELEGPASLVVIGGCAAAIGYRVSIGTQDIDTFASNLGRIASAAEAARAKTGLLIPISNAAIADVPWNYEDRLVSAMPHLRNLRLRLLERHDLVLSKMVRGSEHDFQQIKALHKGMPLDLDTLRSRYKTEMGHVIGDGKVLRLGLLVLVEELFGRSAAKRFEDELDDK